MIVLSAGMKKSGTTWLFQLINDLLQSIGHQDSLTLIGYLPRPAMLRKPYSLQLLLGTIPHWAGKTYALKTHTPPIPLMKTLISKGVMKAIYSYRDPRDGALSMKDFGERLRGENRLFPPRASKIYTNEQAIHAMRRQVEIWSSWKEIRSAHMVRYEDLKADTLGQLRSISGFLELQVSDDVLSSIINKYDKNKIPSKKALDIKFNKGESQRYLKEFTPDQLILSDQVFSPYLAQMGYPTYSSINDNP